jgi:phage recombination protein Bet
MSTENNTQLAVLPQAALVRQVDAAQWNALKEMFDQASDQSVGLVLDYCKARKLDPMKKPVHIVPVWSNRRGCMVETVWPGISEIRTTAARTGAFVGQDETKFGPILTQDVGNAKGFQFPEWAQVTVYRLVKDQRCAFVGPRVYFLEAYAVTKKGEYTPNSMWSKRTWGQLEKCAEAAALRRAFPEETGLTADEMAGKVLDPEFEQMPNVTGTGETGAGTTVETTKRAAVPKKAKGAAALTPVPAVPTEISVVAEPSANVSTSAAGNVAEPPPVVTSPAKEDPAPAAPATETIAEPPPPSPEEQAKPSRAAAAPAWPRTVTGCVTQCQEAPVRNNPKYQSVFVGKLGGGHTEINGQRVQLADLGRVVFDPEKPELKEFAKQSDQLCEFTIEEQPSSSNPAVKNKVIIAAKIAGEAVEV